MASVTTPRYRRRPAETTPTSVYEEQCLFPAQTASGSVHPFLQGDRVTTWSRPRRAADVWPRRRGPRSVMRVAECVDEVATTMFVRAMIASKLLTEPSTSTTATYTVCVIVSSFT